MFYTPEDFKKIIKEALREELLYGHFQIKKETPKTPLPNTDQQIFTVEEAAAYLHMSVPTLRKKYSKRIIQRVQQGRKITFKKEHLEAYLEKFTIK